MEWKSTSGKATIWICGIIMLFSSSFAGAVTTISLEDAAGNAFIRIKKGDTATVRVMIDSDTIRAQGAAVYITFNDTIFSVVDQGVDTVVHPFNFTDGVFGTRYTENNTHGDPGNAITGFQIDASIVKSTGYNTGKGLVARFYLVAKANAESSLVSIDYDLGNHRDTRLHRADNGTSEPFWFREPLRITVGLSTGIGDNAKAKIPDDFSLSQNFPNPFNPSTSITFAVPKGSQVTLKIYNLLGQLVRTLVNDYKSAGEYSVRWDGMDESGLPASSGIYVYSVTAGSWKSSKKMLLLK